MDPKPTPGLDAPADESALWAKLAGAADASAFCQAWLDIQCARAPGARAGLILLECEEGSFAPAAIWPGAPCDITHLKEAAEQALTTGQAVVRGGEGEGGRTHVAYPVTAGERICGVVVLDLDGRSQSALQQALRHVHWGVGWLASMGWRHQAEGEAVRLKRGAVAIDMVAVAQEHGTLDAAAMAVANEMAVRMRADRVAIGLVHKGDIRLAAMSHAAWFRKRSSATEAVEEAMEEALDQSATIIHPAPAGPTRITLAHARLAAMVESAHVLSVLMADRGRTIGVLTLERREDEPFSAEEVLICEAVADVVGPVIEMHARERRWVSGRGREEVEKGLKALLGPRRPVAKVGTASALIAALFLFLPGADFRISADSALEGSVQRAAAAPFAGFIASSEARPGTVVKAGQVLATLDDRDLKLDRLRWAGERDRLDQRYRAALGTHNRPEMSVLGPQLRQAEAQLALTEYKLARTRIVAPIDGIVVSGDLSQLVGAPIEEGKVLYEVAPLDSYRVALKVEEGDIRYLKPGQRGEFAPTGLAGGTIPFVVTRLTSVSSAEEGNNTFRVEARLRQAPAAGLRPGMEGVAKVHVGEASRFWIWTRGVRDWLRLFFWKWTP